MILIIATFVIMLVVAYAQFRNGLFGAVAMLVQVVIAGLVTFWLWEPLANALDSAFRGGKMAGYEDWLALTLIFVVALAGLRFVTNQINPNMIEYNGIAQQIGGAVVGLFTGYLVAGFIVCVLETLPLEQNFLGFEPRAKDEPGYRSYLPPDRVWLGMMRYAGAYPLSWTADNDAAASAFDRYPTFDRHGTFELRYERHRRHAEGKGPLPYSGEFETK
jgi:hypothetical protein